jgi:hypothetical protein
MFIMGSVSQEKVEHGLQHGGRKKEATESTSQTIWNDSIWVGPNTLGPQELSSLALACSFVSNVAVEQQ